MPRVDCQTPPELRTSLMPSNTKEPDPFVERVGVDSGRKLFVPKHFEFAEEREILAFIAANPFAHLVSAEEDGVRLTGAPIIYRRDINEEDSKFKYEFIGHLAKRNPQADAILDGIDVVALIQGPNAYISPRWNVENASLPTWSYVSVQVRGVAKGLTKLDETREVLEQTISHMERYADAPWRLEDAPEKLVELLIHHILAFRFKVTDLQGIRRLNQNRPKVDRHGIVEGLQSSENSGARQIAELMQVKLDENDHKQGWMLRSHTGAYQA